MDNIAIYLMVISPSLITIAFVGIVLLAQRSYEKNRRAAIKKAEL